jgi:hypothetical protein
MRFHWLQDRECQKQFRIYWQLGKLNYADYWTKHHAGKHHHNIRKEFLTPVTALEMLRLEQKQSLALATTVNTLTPCKGVMFWQVQVSTIP